MVFVLFINFYKDVIAVLKGRTKPEPTPQDPTPEPDPAAIRQAIAKSRGMDENDLEEEEEADEV
jgi:hypothetical protein